MPYQKYIKEMDSKFKIRIRERGREMVRVVEAPLPDNFGFSVGAAYSTPFDTMALNETLQKAFAVGGVSQKTNMSMRKMFVHQEPTEISFELEFEAYYSARDDVLLPVFNLIMMTLPSNLEFDEAAEEVQSVVNLISKKSNTALGALGFDTKFEENTDNVSNFAKDAEVRKYGSKAMGLLSFVEAPNKIDIMFGDVFRITDAYISSASPQFSNNLDSDGVPMSAKVSITITPEKPPTKEGVSQWFSRRG